MECLQKMRYRQRYIDLWPVLLAIWEENRESIQSIVYQHVTGIALKRFVEEHLQEPTCLLSIHIMVLQMQFILQTGGNCLIWNNRFLTWSAPFSAVAKAQLLLNDCLVHSVGSTAMFETDWA